MSDERLQMTKKERLLFLEEQMAAVEDIQDAFARRIGSLNSRLSELAQTVDSLRRDVDSFSKEVMRVAQKVSKLETKHPLPNDMRALMASLASLQVQIDDVRDRQKAATSELEVER